MTDNTQPEALDLAETTKETNMSQEKLDHVVAGAIFDFMGWLTTRQEKLVLSSADDAAPAAEAVKEFLTMRGVAQDCEPMIHDWPARCSMVNIETLISVLCDPEGKCCISGSDDDRRLIDSAPTPPAQTADSVTAPAAGAVAGPTSDLHPEKCPITGRPFFMTLDHPELGRVPTYGGPYDSYTIPAPEGEPTDPWHERELRSERYDHDAGWWVEGGEPIPLRIVHEDVLFELQEDAEAAAAPTPPAQAADSVLEDAARYRWLRATTNYVTSNGERIDVRNTPEKWDAVRGGREQLWALQRGATYLHCAVVPRLLDGCV